MENRPRYSGFYHGIKSVFHDAGVSGLYRVRRFVWDSISLLILLCWQGASANVTGAGISWGLYFFLSVISFSF